MFAVDTWFRGGDGWTNSRCDSGQQNQPGVALTSSRLTLVGVSSSIRGGISRDAGSCQFGLRPAPSVVGRGTLIADPSAVLDPPPAATIAVTRRAEPVTRSSLAGFGGTLRLDITASTGALAATFVSLPGPALATPIGTFWLDPATMALVDLATIDLTGQRSVQFASLTVPNGVPLLFQTATLSANTLGLTVPAVTIVGP